jgi:hypothetical protein
MKLLAMITDGKSVDRYLTKLGGTAVAIHDVRSS